MNAVPKHPREPAEPRSRGEQIGRLLMIAGHLTAEQVEQVIAVQQNEGLLFGEAAQRLGLLSAPQIEHTLLLQFGAFGVPDAESGLHPSLVAALAPFSPQAESIRDLRSQLTLRWLKDGRKALAFVAVREGDGCSSIAANLAIAFAQMGERTVLIDANLRSPRLHELFAVENRVGLSSVLSNRVSVKEALLEVPTLPGLTLMPAGPAPPNPQELIGCVMFDYLAETIPAACDAMIIDTPAMSTCADAQLIAAKVGACALVVRRHKTATEDVRRATELLTQGGTTVIGAVLND